MTFIPSILIRFHITQYMMYRKILFISILLNIYSLAWTQIDKSQYQLLWEISGNGLSKKSYLFGSMHIRDARAFEFSDSLLAKIDECEAFATEVRIDSIIEYLVKETPSIFNFDPNTEKTDKSDDEALLPPTPPSITPQNTEKKNEEQDSLPPAPIPTFGNKEFPFWMQPKSWTNSKHLVKEDDYPTFLDAYLAGIAYKQHKKLFGLELLDEHLKDISTSFFKEDMKFKFSNNQAYEATLYEEMIKMYQEGRIDLMDSMFYDFIRTDEVFIKRNLQMLSSLERIMQNYSVFAVVGALHLPGDKGLISLLRKAGYTVKLVPVSFNSDVKDYKFSNEEQKIKWHPIILEEDGYEIDLPGSPIDLPFSEFGGILKGNFYPDFYTGINYFSMSVKHIDGNFSQENYETMVKEMLKNLNGRMLHSKTVKYDDIEGYECVAENKQLATENVRIRILLKNRMIYVLMITTIKSQIEHQDIYRFFDSFKTFKINTKAETLSHDEGAFEVRFPSKHQYLKQSFDIDEEGRKQNVHLFLSSDVNNNARFLLRYQDYEEGYVLADNEEIFTGFEEMIKEEMFVTQIERKDIKKGVYAGKEINFISHTKNTFTKAQIFPRGNRVYALLVDANNEDFIEKCFDSFEFKKFIEPNLNYKTLKNTSVKVLFPPTKVSLMYDTIKRNYNFIEDEVTHINTDTNTGSVFMFSESKLSKYFYYPDADSLFSYCTKNILEAQDSLLQESKIEKKENYIYKTYLSNNKQTSLWKKTRIMIRNNIMYAQTIFFPKELKDADFIEAYFSSIKFLEDSVQNTVFTSKTKDLLKNLASEDSLKYYPAMQVLADYPFDEADLPLLYAALQKDYGNNNNTIKTELLQNFPFINDQKTVSVIKKLYQDNEIRPYNTLNTLLSIANEESFEYFLEILNNKENLFFSIPLLEKFLEKDSTSFIKNYEKILALGNKYPSYNYILYRLGSDIIEKNNPENLDMYLKKILEHSKQDFLLIKKDKKNHPVNTLNNFISIYEDTPMTTDVYTYFQELMAYKAKYSWYKIGILEILIKNNKTIESKWIDDLLKKQYLDLIRLFKKYDKLDLINSKKLDKDVLAEKMMEELVLEYYDYTIDEKIQLKNIEYRVVDFLGKKIEIAIFKVKLKYKNWEKEVVENTYLGIVGVLPTKDNDFDLSSEITNLSDAIMDFKEINLEVEIQKLLDTSESYMD